MTPLVFVSGILLGTAFSIFFGLAVVALLMAMLGVDTPRVADEIGPLLGYSALFLVLTTASALGFMAMLKKHQKRWLAQGIMWSTWVVSIAGLIMVKG
ncbi:MAG: hypothetical protein AB8G18_09215 [Gammaproteobacteria bacterium]